MRPERWPGEPLIERLTIEERHEIQASNVRQWTGAKRRRKFDEQRKADEKTARDARRAAYTVPKTPCTDWKPYRGERKPHPEGQRPYQRWDGRTRVIPRA